MLLLAITNALEASSLPHFLFYRITSGCFSRIIYSTHLTLSTTFASHLFLHAMRPVFLPILFIMSCTIENFIQHATYVPLVNCIRLPMLPSHLYWPYHTSQTIFIYFFRSLWRFYQTYYVSKSFIFALICFRVIFICFCNVFFCFYPFFIVSLTFLFLNISCIPDHFYLLFMSLCRFSGPIMYPWHSYLLRHVSVIFLFCFCNVFFFVLFLLTFQCIFWHFYSPIIVKKDILFEL
jgi:hypothetical protein